MKKQSSQDTTPTCNVSNMAKLLNLSVRRVQALVQEGVLPRPENGRYDIFGCVHRYIDHIKAKSASASIARTKAELLEIERQTKEFRLAKERSLYILDSEVVQELVKRIIMLKRDFKVLENRLLKHPEAKEIVRKGHYDMMVKYSSRTGVFRERGKQT